jgi:hypothetical protein
MRVINTSFRTPEQKNEEKDKIRARVMLLDDLDSDERETTISRGITAVANGQRADNVNVEVIANSVRSKRGPGNPARPKRNTFPKARW